jgi:predicted RNA binding protein YcfA (HicA-like mRNA interferase family)
MLLRAGFVWLRSKGSHRIYQAGARRIVVPFHAGVTLHPKTVKEVIDAIAECWRPPTEPV